MNILSAITGGAISAIGDTIKKFVTTEEDRLKAAAEIETILQRRDAEIEQTIRSEIEASKSIIVAEMAQGDVYTKRARPTVVYAGLGFIFLNYVFFPILTWAITLWRGTGVPTPALSLPSEFWVAWGSVVGIWSIGRSMERRGVGGAIVGKIVGK